MTEGPEIEDEGERSIHCRGRGRSRIISVHGRSQSILPMCSHLLVKGQSKTLVVEAIRASHWSVVGGRSCSVLVDASRRRRGSACSRGPLVERCGEDLGTSSEREGSKGGDGGLHRRRGRGKRGREWRLREESGIGPFMSEIRDKRPAVMRRMTATGGPGVVVQLRQRSRV